MASRIHIEAMISQHALSQARQRPQPRNELAGVGIARVAKVSRSSSVFPEETAAGSVPADTEADKEIPF
ncbi:hypothetical protein SAMN04487819_109204 [Actinopolyspora alba]|uniref:Uncharacterized protein n=1 Tax=Actinopolyspora alba TaxID=673379 RepID=A0A1I1YRS3_9ACTN|nr:hypothetical protein [Actinopolyspora alba]SFE22226.1 hypothetical protein SAMN04487819_109204 [Actinopolyspora alba]